jgi:hypothetical protein
LIGYQGMPGSAHMQFPGPSIGYDAVHVHLGRRQRFIGRGRLPP